MKKNIVIYCFWISLQIGIVSLGFYVWNSTLVPGSLTGLNPYGLIALMIAIVLVISILLTGRYIGIDQMTYSKK